MTSPVEVQAYLGGMNYPANRREIIETARSNGARDDVIRLLEEKLSDRTYEGPNGVSRELGRS